LRKASADIVLPEHEGTKEEHHDEGSSMFRCVIRVIDPASRPGEVIGFSCSSGSSPHLLQASHDCQRTFFVDGDTEELAVLVG
jgi:hypothetical protein